MKVGNKIICCKDYVHDELLFKKDSIYTIDSIKFISDYNTHFDSFFNIKDNYIPSEWYTINNGHDRCKEFSQYKMDNLNFLYEYFISIKEHRKLKLNELKKIKL